LKRSKWAPSSPLIMYLDTLRSDEHDYVRSESRLCPEGKQGGEESAGTGMFQANDARRKRKGRQTS
jgi:hypothetical protein